MSKIIELNDDNFEGSVIKSSVPVLVDFWAEWCTPCRMVAPILETISAQYADKLVVGKLNVDAGQKTATKFGVRSIPTLLFFKDGKPMRQFVGFMAEKELKKNLDAALSG
ncbi:MAG: thioredoxin [Dehalococcoidia bacterium]|nr:thioredoxin [Dehalococcoidia bacterium]